MSDGDDDDDDDVDGGLDVRVEVGLRRIPWKGTCKPEVIVLVRTFLYM